MNTLSIKEGKHLWLVQYLDMMQLAWMLAPLLVIMGALDQLVLLQVLEWVHFNQLRQFLLLLSLMQLGKLLPLLLKLLVLQVDKLQALNLGLDLVTTALVLDNHKLDHEGPNLGLHLQLDNELLHSP